MATLPPRPFARTITTTLTLTALISAGVSTTAYASSKSGSITLSALAFSPTSVDATPGYVTAELDWTVEDSNASATTIQGTVEIRQQTAAGDFIGPAYDVPFGLPLPLIQGSVYANDPSTAQESSYTYNFQVPQYTADTSAVWTVQRVTASDDQSDSLNAGAAKLAGFAHSVTATELADASVPTIDYVGFDSTYQSSYFYDGGVSPKVGYSIGVSSADAGFWHGKLHLRSTAGQTLAEPFSLTYNADGTTSCGNGPDAGVNWGASTVYCDVIVDIPADAPAGTWTVDGITLVDATGATGNYAHLGDVPVQVTDDKALQADDFSLSPSTFNNWITAQHLSLSLTPVGARDGISSVTVQTTPACVGGTTQSPAVAADGSVTVSIYMGPGPYDKQCTVTGIAVVDGAGDVAVYGSTFGGPALNLVANQIPDTNPVALSATLSSPTITAGQAEQLTVNVSTIAGISQVDVVVYDSTGAQVSWWGSNVGGPVTGTVTQSVPVASLAPGTYTVAFTLADAANLQAGYGYPIAGSQPMPGGPLQFTVVAG